MKTNGHCFNVLHVTNFEISNYPLLLALHTKRPVQTELHAMNLVACLILC